MSWERDPLWAKARLFFDRAFSVARNDPLFGLWCSLGLELVARSALASISPTLLAEPDDDHKYLLHALNRGSDRIGRRSIGTAKVFSLCKTLFSQFTEDNLKASIALANRRNEELHTGSAAFADYPSRHWILGFYEACRALTDAMGESLETLFGKEEADMAQDMLTENRNDVRQRVQSAIAAHRTVFEDKPAPVQQVAREIAEKEAAVAAHQRCHRVKCPACKSVAVVAGRPFGNENITHAGEMIVMRQAVVPKTFSCSACGLNLNGYTELDVADLGGHYTRTTEFTPEEYYDLINPETFDPTPYVEEYLANLQEYDNE